MRVGGDGCGRNGCNKLFAGAGPEVDERPDAADKGCEPKEPANGAVELLKCLVDAVRRCDPAKEGLNPCPVARKTMNGDHRTFFDKQIYSKMDIKSSPKSLIFRGHRWTTPYCGP